MTKSKFFSIFVAVIMAFGIVACDNSVEYLKINNEVPPSIEVNDACEIRNAIRAVIADLRTQEHVSFSNIITPLCQIKVWHRCKLQNDNI